MHTLGYILGQMHSNYIGIILHGKRQLNVEACLFYGHKACERFEHHDTFCEQERSYAAAQNYRNFSDIFKEELKRFLDMNRQIRHENKMFFVSFMLEKTHRNSITLTHPFRECVSECFLTCCARKHHATDGNESTAGLDGLE